MKQTILYLMRHGDVENPKKILYGRLRGFGLSNEGKMKVNYAIDILKKEGIDLIYTSPMLRARQTASIAGKLLQKKPVVSFLINEVKLFCGGISIDDYRKKHQEKLYSEKNIKLGQESIESISARMMKFLDYIKSNHVGKKVLAVSHGDPILILKSATLQIPFTWKYKINNYLKTGTYIKIICNDNICV